MDARREERVYFSEKPILQAEVKINDRSLTGFVEDISESGVAIGLTSNAEIPEEAIDSAITGVLSDADERLAPIRFGGRLVWFSSKQAGRHPHTVLGANFFKPIDLPPQMVAIAMAGE